MRKGLWSLECHNKILIYPPFLASKKEIPESVVSPLLSLKQGLILPFVPLIQIPLQKEQRSRLWGGIKPVSTLSNDLLVQRQIELNKLGWEPVHPDPLLSFYERPRLCSVYPSESAILKLLRARMNPLASHPEHHQMVRWCFAVLGLEYHFRRLLKCLHRHPLLVLSDLAQRGGLFIWRLRVSYQSFRGYVPIALWLPA